jgi:carboxymethylenebutenolidase
MGKTIDFAIGDIQTTAYVASPDGAGPFPGAVVAFHKDGIDDFTRWVVDDLAKNGYSAIAPNSYHVMPPGESIERRREFLADEQITLDFKAAADWLVSDGGADAGRLAILGHCMGGRNTWVGLVSLPDVFRCGCAFYSGNAFGQVGTVSPPAERFASIEAPVAGFFGNDDRNPSPEDVDRMDRILTELGKEHEFHRYDGAGHAFMGASPDKFREHAARDAWTKALAFMARHVGGNAPEVAGVYSVGAAA